MLAIIFFVTSIGVEIINTVNLKMLMRHNDYRDIIDNFKNFSQVLIKVFIRSKIKHINKKHVLHY